MKLKLLCYIFLITMLAAFPTNAAVEYIHEADALWVTDYPADWPCTPALLLNIDRQLGWQKVSRNAETGEYLIDCSVWIGKNDRSSTYFQIGSKDHPQEKMTVKGNLRVFPNWISGENKPASYVQLRSWSRRNVNRLIIGSKDAPNIKTSLHIDNSERKGYTITIGGKHGNPSKNYGGQLHVYNSSISPAGEMLIGAGTPLQPFWVGGNNSLIMENSHISGIKLGFKQLTSGVFNNSSFDNCGTAIYGSYQKIIKNCVFENCGTAVVSGNRRLLTIEKCVFKNNKINWAVHPTHGKRIMAIDCDFDEIQKGKLGSKGNKSYFIAKKHIVIMVVDVNDKPLEGIKVRAVPDRRPPDSAFDLNHSLTGADGKTPSPGKPGALLLSYVLIEKGELPVKLKVHDFSYNIEICKKDKILKKVKTFLNKKKTLYLIKLDDNIK